MVERTNHPVISLPPYVRSAKAIVASGVGNYHISGSLIGMRKVTNAYRFPVRIGQYIYNVDEQTYMDI